MSFHVMAYATAIAGCVLGLRFIWFGASVLEQWGVTPTDGAIVIARRLGALYIGLAVLFFVGRNAGPSELRSAVCLGIGTASALLAVLGIWELAVKRVTVGIIIPVIAEVALAAGFAWTWWNG